MPCALRRHRGPLDRVPLRAAVVVAHGARRGAHRRARRRRRRDASSAWCATRTRARVDSPRVRGVRAARRAAPSSGSRRRPPRSGRRRGWRSITGSAAVAIGEASIVIVAASAHRGEAFAVCRYAIERVKQIAPIWKHEYFEGGDVWIEGAAADPDDDGGARARRERTGMRVTVRLFARLRDLAGAGGWRATCAPGATIARRLARRRRSASGAGAVRRARCRRAEPRVRAPVGGRRPTPTKSRFMPPVSGG